MKILLSYSTLHFDPLKAPEEHKYWGASASILAKSLYEVLSEIGTVVYIDQKNYNEIKGMDFDLFVGIGSSFYDIIKLAKVKKSIYFAVNMHPIERNKILKEFVRNENLPYAVFCDRDLVDENTIKKSIDNADYILSVGNIVTYNSYIKYGVPKSKIKIINYGIPSANTKATYIRDGSKKNYIYAASEIGLRKGFDIIYDILTNKDIQALDFHIDIVGLPTNRFYKNKIEIIQNLLGSKVSFHGWIDSNQYKNIFLNSDFILFPSLEEGQAGSVLDAISFGIIPLISKNTGIDYSPIGNLELKLKSKLNYDLFKKSFNLTNDEVFNLKTKTLEYYHEFHHDFKKNLEDCIRSCTNGQLNPKISIILPIFNKEKTIGSLLNYLDLACNEYKNVELHIFFDGCKDRSEEIVRNFYNKKHSYEVTFEVTPNIFEVKSNNLGLKKSIGKYCVIIQDDIYIYDKNILFEAINFLDKTHKVVILGGLAGVNFYPRGTKGLSGSGQIMCTENEVYWRQDTKTDPELKNRIFQVDACMRGPLFIRKSFLENYGYLDEIYAPLYQDDMDICFRAHQYGYKVYCILMNVENKSLTMAKYDAKKWTFFNEIMKRNTNIFYSRYAPSMTKDYLWINRNLISDLSSIDKADSSYDAIMCIEVWSRLKTRFLRFCGMVFEKGAKIIKLERLKRLFNLNKIKAKFK